MTGYSLLPSCIIVSVIGSILAQSSVPLSTIILTTPTTAKEITTVSTSKPITTTINKVPSTPPSASNDVSSSQSPTKQPLPSTFPPQTTTNSASYLNVLSIASLFASVLLL